MAIVLASTRSTRARARASAHAALDHAPGEAVHVVDVDGTYLPVGAEAVTVADPADVARLRLTLDPEQLAAAVTAVHACGVARAEKRPVLALTPGIVLVGSPARLLEEAAAAGLLVIARTTHPEDADDVDPVLTPQMYAVGPHADLVHDRLVTLSSSWRQSRRAIDLLAACVPHRVLADDAVLVTRLNAGAGTTITATAEGLARDGRPMTAIDLGGLDPSSSWVVDGREPGGPGAPARTGPLLSRNPDLVELVTRTAELLRADPAADPEVLLTDDLTVRGLLRAQAEAFGPAGLDGLTDPAALEAWVLEPVPAGDRHPVARYLAGVRADRPDLRDTFPHLPGVDSAALARWALDYGVNERPYSPDLLRRAAARTTAAQPPAEDRDRAHRKHGVNLVGYLTGELGVGESARLMDKALGAAGVPTSTFAVSRDLQSRAALTYRRSEPVLYDTTLLCVNADQTPRVAGDLADVVRGTHRIGMWYWEVESFPANHPGFSHVDEIWVATDFVRDAVGARSPVPVRTVMPPLPQRAAEPGPLPERLGIPAGRPWFLFMFDFLSTAERKNPWGLLDAFTRAFPEGGQAAGPLLVIKTINADKRLKESERLRLLVAGREDVLLVEDYLDPAERDALVAHCTAYVSLHRAEGLGLTIAEAMAWGKPVVATGYSGNMQFMTAQNSFPVPWSPVAIPEGCEPYPPGTPWAEPDLDAAAALLRLVVDDPEQATQIGARAASDIRELHGAAAAGLRVKRALARRPRNDAAEHQAPSRWIGGRLGGSRRSR